MIMMMMMDDNDRDGCSGVMVVVLVIDGINDCDGLR